MKLRVSLSQTFQQDSWTGGNVQLPIQHLSKIKWTKKKILLLLRLGEPGLSLAEKKGNKDKKGKERLARKYGEGLEKNDKGNLMVHNDIFFCLKPYILIDH